MKKVLFLFCLVFLVVAIPAQTQAGYDGDGGPNLCNFLYYKVDKIVLSYEQSIPYDGVDWKDVMEYHAGNYRRLLKGSDIQVIIDKDYDLENIETGALGIKYFFAYVAKEDFSIPKYRDVFVGWTQRYRNPNDITQFTKTLPNWHKFPVTQSSLQPVSASFRYNKNIPGAKLSVIGEKFKENFLTSLTIPPACSVSHYTLGKQCQGRTWNSEYVEEFKDVGPCIPQSFDEYTHPHNIQKRLEQEE